MDVNGGGIPSSALVLTSLCGTSDLCENVPDITVPSTKKQWLGFSQHDMHKAAQAVKGTRLSLNRKVKTILHKIGVPLDDEVILSECPELCRDVDDKPLSLQEVPKVEESPPKSALLPIIIRIKECHTNEKKSTLENGIVRKSSVGTSHKRDRLVVTSKVVVEPEPSPPPESPPDVRPSSMAESSPPQDISLHRIRKLIKKVKRCWAGYDEDASSREVSTEALQALSVEISKLKISGKLLLVNQADLFIVLKVMDPIITSGSDLCSGVCEEELDGDRLAENLIRSLSAAAVVANILSAEGIPKEMIIEETIEHLVSFVRNQLENTLYPLFDSSCQNTAGRGTPVRVRQSSSRPSRKANSILSKVVEVVELLDKMISSHKFVDCIILQVCNIGIGPFFVEGICELQLVALQLVRNIFLRYPQHRETILGDILSSLARVPYNKRNLRNYRLHNSQAIQMFTCLIMQLLQSSIDFSNKYENSDVWIVQEWEAISKSAQDFLAFFITKCGAASKDELDFRPLFESFVQDLLSVHGLPEWPSSELMLLILQKLLVVVFNSKNNEVGLRVSALDNFAMVLNHFQTKSCLAAKKVMEDVTSIMLKITDAPMTKELLEEVLVAYLWKQGQDDQGFRCARDFLLGQLIYECQLEREHAVSDPDVQTVSSSGLSEAYLALEARKSVLFSWGQENAIIGPLRSINSLVSYDDMSQISSHLYMIRPLCATVQSSVQHILTALNDSVVAIRSKALKCMTALISASPEILKQDDIKQSINARLLDVAASVREVAVDTLGQQLISNPDLVDQYYSVLGDRIMDTSVSVRKRVVRILKDLAELDSSSSRLTDICVKLLKRIQDEDGIKELVIQFFQKQWFMPSASSKKIQMVHRVSSIISVMKLCNEVGYDWLESLLKNLLDDEKETRKSGMKALQDIVSSMMSSLQSESCSGDDLVACSSFLSRISQFFPSLFESYAIALQPFLCIKTTNRCDAQVLQNICSLLSNTLPCIEHHDPSFLSSIEDSLMKLVLKQGQSVVQSAMECLSVVINSCTKNIQLILGCFDQYLAFLKKIHISLSSSPSQPLDSASKMGALRALFIVGLLCKEFNFSQDEGNEKEKRLSHALDICLFFCDCSDEEVSLKGLLALGFISIKEPSVLCHHGVKELCCGVLGNPNSSMKKKCMVIKNFHTFLVEEEKRIKKADEQDRKTKKAFQVQESIKEILDPRAVEISSAMQLYLKFILESYYSKEPIIRMNISMVINLIITQGLVHPAQCIPCIVAMVTDSDSQIRTRGELLLTEIEGKHPGFANMQAPMGMKMAFCLQSTLSMFPIIRGFRMEPHIASHLSHLYTLLRGSKQIRRNFQLSILRILDDTSYSAEMQLYVADNLAHFPYQTLEELLFIIHTIDVLVSVSGTSIIQAVEELAGRIPKTRRKKPPNSKEDAIEGIVSLESLRNHLKPSIGPFLMLLSKRHLMKEYNVSESKCLEYSPVEPSKNFEKTSLKREDVLFDPTSVLKYLTDPQAYQTKEAIINFFSEFKELLMVMDSEEGPEDGIHAPKLGPSPLSADPPQPRDTSETVVITPTRMHPDISETSQVKKMPSAKKRRKKRKSVVMDDSDPDERDT